AAVAMGLTGRRRERGRLGHGLNDLGLLARPPRQEALNRRDRVHDLLLGHRLDAPAVLELHLARHQQGADFHVCGWLIFPHFGNRRWPTLPEVSQQRGDELRTEPRTLTRGRIRPARVSLTFLATLRSQIPLGPGVGLLNTL